ncbi:MAG: NUDIX domain-containing protein [Pseudomonadota bacterium]
MLEQEQQFTTDVTVSAIAERDGRFLCIEEVTRNGVVVNLPGGHIESGESAESAVIREVMEETRWHFTPQGFVGAYLWLDLQRSLRSIRLVFCGDVQDESQSTTLDAGILSVHWRSRDAIAADAHRLRSPIVLTALDDFIAGRREQWQVPLDIATPELTNTISNLSRRT